MRLVSCSRHIVWQPSSRTGWRVMGGGWRVNSSRHKVWQPSSRTLTSRYAWQNLANCQLQRPSQRGPVGPSRTVARGTIFLAVLAHAAVARFARGSEGNSRTGRKPVPGNHSSRLTLYIITKLYIRMSRTCSVPPRDVVFMEVAAEEADAHQVRREAWSVSRGA